jgi:ribosomal protein L7Ae-like RNA K-turn-binding protein
MKRKIYMEVTQDEYELPIRIADSRSQLARMCGVSKAAVSVAISHWKNGDVKRSRFVMVEVDDEEGEDG